MHSRALASAVLTFVAAGLLAVEIWSWPSSARFGPTVDPRSACSVRIAAVDGTGQRAGLRPGDALVFDRMSADARLAVFYRYLPMQTGRANEAIVLAIQRGNRQLNLPYVLKHTDSPATFIAQLAFKFFVLAVGVFVLWRGRDRASLVLGIWCIGVAIALPDAWWGALPPQGRLVGGVLAAALWTYSPLVLYLVIESIAGNTPRRAVLTARTAMLVTVAPALLVNTVNPAMQASTGCALVSLGPWAVNALFTCSQLVILAFFALCYLRTSGLVKQRLRWIFWAFVISRFGVLLNLLNRLAPHPVQLSGVEWLTVMIFPLGCAYAILRHRIIDVNFVLNRTLVYTVLTTFAVGIFVLLEDILTKVAVTRGVGLAVELAVALGLGLSFNALHKRTEGLLERTLFRRKHEAARSLQRLAEEASYMESADALLVRATTEIPKAIGAQGAALYERRDGAYRLAAASGDKSVSQVIPIDDPGFVRLRKDRSQVDLSDVSSALGAEGIAFALTIRGQLFGAFVCDRSSDGESYAPDEVAMVRKTVHDVGAELHAMRDRERTDLLTALLSGSVDLERARAKLSIIG